MTLRGGYMIMHFPDEKTGLREVKPLSPGHIARPGSELRQCGSLTHLMADVLLAGTSWPPQPALPAPSPQPVLGSERGAWVPACPPGLVPRPPVCSQPLPKQSVPQLSVGNSLLVSVPNSVSYSLPPWGSLRGAATSFSITVSTSVSRVSGSHPWLHI